MEIGEILKEKRNDYKLTQEKLAEKIFVSNKTISNWENGKTTPDIDSLIRLSHLFNLSLDNLLLEDSNIVKDMREKEQAYTIQKALALGAQLTNILLLIFLFLPGISNHFYMSDSMYFILLLIIFSNGYTVLTLNTEVRKYKKTDLFLKKMDKLTSCYFIISVLIYALIIVIKFIL